MSDSVQERLRDEYETLGLMSYHGGADGGPWYADLTEQDIGEIRDLLRDAGVALRAERGLREAAEAERDKAQDVRWPEASRSQSVPRP